MALSGGDRTYVALALFVYNVVQILVAADKRYRPLYDRGVGAELTGQLRRAGYPPGSGTPVVLVGYSGGAQLATGTVQEVVTQLDAPVTVVLLGGFHNGANDVSGAAAVHQLTSGADAIERIGRWIFPLRWPVTPRSPWNRARRAGKPGAWAKLAGAGVRIETVRGIGYRMVAG